METQKYWKCQCSECTGEWIRAYEEKPTRCYFCGTTTRDAITAHITHEPPQTEDCCAAWGRNLAKFEWDTVVGFNHLLQSPRIVVGRNRRPCKHCVFCGAERENAIVLRDRVYPEEMK